MASLFRKITCIVVKSPKFTLTVCNYSNLRQTALKFGKLRSNLTFRAIASQQGIQESISALQLKKRTIRKKKSIDDDKKQPGMYNVVAFSTAEEYDLDSLQAGLNAQALYDAKPVENNADAIHAVAKYQLEDEPREIFFFREGSVVLWNITDLEGSNLLAFLRQYESDSYSEGLVLQESEAMAYSNEKGAEGGSCMAKNGDFRLLCTDRGGDSVLDKYTFSNAMALSVKLGVWEASLEQYIDNLEVITEDLKRGSKIRISRQEALRRHGELFALRHLINLSSDLLDTPDFYWENEQLETLYNQVCNYFGISKRTRVMNEKINHCVELIELVSANLNDKHHVRLEWMIIVLIMVEVGFETIHYLSR